jgi:hypothetical protein
MVQKYQRPKSASTRQTAGIVFVAWTDVREENRVLAESMETLLRLVVNVQCGYPWLYQHNSSVHCVVP